MTGSPDILVAGIGNLFLGDDAFGGEVVRRFARRSARTDVHAVDFGIRGLDLAYALVDPYKAAILVDAAPRGGNPGDLYLLEIPKPAALESVPDAHGMDPVKVLAFAARIGTPCRRILLLGCEPSPSDIIDMAYGLTSPVAAAVDRAVLMIEQIVDDILNEAAAECPSAG